MLRSNSASQVASPVLTEEAVSFFTMAGSVEVLTPTSDAAAASGSVPTMVTAAAAAAQTCIVFDYDDTILASSWLAQNGLRLDGNEPVPAEAQKQLSQLAASAAKLLQHAQAYGEVVIITNAETGWVELSAKKFMPSLLPILAKTRVISARSTYESQYSSPLEWKIAAFSNELAYTFGKATDTPKNIISVGDSVHERAALQKVTAGIPSVLAKSLKLVERPTIEQLQRQLDLILSCFDEIVNHKGALDLMLTIKILTGY